MYLTNAIVGGKDILTAKKNTGQQIDKLELGFEFGTWSMDSYYDYFNYFCDLKTTQSLNHHKFTEEEKKKIRKQLRKDIKTFPKNPTKIQQKKAKIMDKMPKTKYCYCCETIVNGEIKKPFSHNHYDNHVKLQIEMKMQNPLGLSDVKHYKKLLKIFQQKKVEIING